MVFPFLYSGAEGRKSAGDVYLPEDVEPETTQKLPVLVICHGFKGFKDWGFLPILAKYFADQGFYTINFNFSHNGCDELGAEEACLDVFWENCLGYEEEDLRRLLTELQTGKLPRSKLADTENVHLMAHSRGGSAAIRAATFPGVKSLVLLASISQYLSVSAEDADQWRRAGVKWIENVRTKTQLPLGLSLLNELLNQHDLIKERASVLSIPLCIIHGRNDTTVPVTAAEELHRWTEDSELHIIGSADHVFGIKHPPSGYPPGEISSELQEVEAISTKFLESVQKEL